VGTTDLDALFIRHIQPDRFCVTDSECPTGSIATTALDICTLSLPVVISAAPCSAAGGEHGPVLVNETQKAELRVTKVS